MIEWKEVNLRITYEWLKVGVDKYRFLGTCGIGIEKTRERLYSLKYNK